MNLTPREKDKLLIAMAAMVARRRLERKVKLNHPEVIALITDFVMEAARDGNLTVADLMEQARLVVSTDQVMDGVAEMIEYVQVEATFPDGTKLVTVHDPINPRITPRISPRVGPHAGPQATPQVIPRVISRVSPRITMRASPRDKNKKQT